MEILLICLKLNISQKDLADLLGLLPQQVNKWVKGKENLTLETIAKLEKALDFQLLNIENIEPSELLENKHIEIPYSQKKYDSQFTIEFKKEKEQIRPLYPEKESFQEPYKEAIA